MRNRIIYHIIFWIAYVLFKGYMNFEAGAFLRDGEKNFSFFLLSAAAQVPFLLIKIPLVYSLFYLTEKYVSNQWSIARTIILAIVTFIVSIISSILINHYLILGPIYKEAEGPSNLFNPGSLLYSFFLLSFVSGIALAIKLVRSNLRQKEIENEIVKKKLETELQFLKAQTNPHFLFNTLNNIYALARKKSDATAHVVMKLSKLLRFMLYESQKSQIPLSEEIQVLEDYIELEKIRYNEKLKISFTKTVDKQWQPIAPLILLPFVENAFKHGAGESRFTSYINIDLSLLNDQLNFMIENPIGEENSLTEQPEKIGLNNVRRQLELMYPRHQLIISNDNSVFKVVLKIQLRK